MPFPCAFSSATLEKRQVYKAGKENSLNQLVSNGAGALASLLVRSNFASLSQEFQADVTEGA